MAQKFSELSYSQQKSHSLVQAYFDKFKSSNADVAISGIVGLESKGKDPYAYFGTSQATQPTTPPTPVSKTNWQDTVTGQPSPAGIGMPKPIQTSQPPTGATYISDPAELSSLTERQIWRDPVSDKIYKKQQATLIDPQGTKKVVDVGSSEANQLLSSGWNLMGAKDNGLIDSNMMKTQQDINIGKDTPANQYMADSALAGMGVDTKLIDEQIKRNLELLTSPEESDLSKQVSTLLGETEDLTGTLTGRGAMQSEEEKKRGIEEQNQLLADKNTELKKKVAEINALTASYQLANQQEEGRPQTLSRLQGAQSQNYKMYLAQKNLLTSEASYLQADLLGMQGKLEASQKAVDRAVDLEYQDRQDVYNAKLSQLSILMPQLEKEEKRYAQALELTLNQQAEALAEQKANKQDIMNIKLKAISAGITDPSILSQIGSANSLDEALQILGTNIPAAVISGGGAYAPTMPQVEIPTFENFITQKEQQIEQSIAFPEEYRAEYEGLKAEALISTADTEIQSLVELVNRGSLTTKQALDEVSKGNENALKLALAGTPAVKDTLQETIAKEKSQLALGLKIHKGLDSSVGATALGRIGIIAKLSGAKQDFIAGVQQLVSGLSLEALIEAKSRGATFGALSDTEMQILASSASKIGTWKITDKSGKVKGYNISHGAIKSELDKISNTLLRGLSSERQTMPDGTVWEQQINGNYKLIE